MPRLRRFEEHIVPRGALELPPNHPAAVEGRSYFKKPARPHRDGEPLLKSGMNSRKIGAKVMKGPWSGMPIYTLTLEERATCPRSCEQWLTCYGNRMPWPHRHKHGPEMERQLEAELRRLQWKHPKGFVVRLHVLGDFYSLEYVRRWATWLDIFPALNVFGYTAWLPGTAIGDEIAALRDKRWDQFAVRTSGGAAGMPRTIVSDKPEPGIITCPAETGQTQCCATCGLCWGTKRDILFLAH